MTPVAAVDCGTNSIRLLVAELGPDLGLVERERRTEIVRLGQGVDATGEFHPDALQRTFTVVEAYAEQIAAAGVPVDRIHFVATSAARDARNREAFFAGVRDRLGVTPDVVTGEREARLSFTGALSGVRVSEEPVLVMDIGGGSTELIVGSASGTPTSAVSLDIGSVRVTERFLGAGPPAAEAVAAATAHVDDLLDGAGVDLGAVRTWIGVAGTATTLAGVHLGLPRYDRARVHGLLLAGDQVAEWARRLQAMTVAEIRALPSMHPGRADVVTAGVLIASRVGRRVTAPGLLVSETDILDGIALELLQER